MIFSNIKRDDSDKFIFATTFLKEQISFYIALIISLVAFVVFIVLCYRLATSPYETLIAIPVTGAALSGMISCLFIYLHKSQKKSFDEMTKRSEEKDKRKKIEDVIDLIDDKDKQDECRVRYSDYLMKK